MIKQVIKLLPTQPLVRQYLVITASYWAFTLTDGALRMLIVLYFYQLGYQPFDIAMLFVFYEAFGVVTNLFGGWLGAKVGLNKTLHIGLGLQIFALLMLFAASPDLTMVYVMVAQALSGIAKDLNKMSAKSAIKLLVAEDAQHQLYQWVALLTGSKNTIKGLGFFMGGLLLTLYGFAVALVIMAAMLSIVWAVSLLLLTQNLGKAQYKVKFRQIFSKSEAINLLSAARLFLFGARDVWFVIALPVYLAAQFGWSHSWVGAFMACWVIGYGIIQSFAPYFTGNKQGRVPTAKDALGWASGLSVIPVIISLGLYADFYPQLMLLAGLLVFGAIFAINSSLHSYLIVRFASRDGVSMDVGFYYMANAMGRLIGTVLSGLIYQMYGLEACLWLSSLFVAAACVCSLKLSQSMAAS